MADVYPGKLLHGAPGAHLERRLKQQRHDDSRRDHRRRDGQTRTPQNVRQRGAADDSCREHEEPAFTNGLEGNADAGQRHHGNCSCGRPGHPRRPIDEPDTHCREQKVQRLFQRRDRPSKEAGQEQEQHQADRGRDTPEPRAYDPKQNDAHRQVQSAAEQVRPVRRESGERLEERQHVQVNGVAVVVERVDEIGAMHGKTECHVAQPHRTP